MERNYGNVGVLDIREADEKIFEDEFKIGNIGVVIYNRKSAPLLKHVHAGNIGASIECEDDTQLVQGKSVLGSEALAELRSPLRLVVLGVFVVQEDLSVEAIARGVDFIHVSGKVICPSHLLPIVQTKMKNLSGKIETYPSGFRLVEKSLSFDSAQLRTLPVGSRLAVFGDLSFDKDISTQAFKERFAGLFVRGNLSIPEGLVESVQSVLKTHGEEHLTVIPDGYECITDDCQINASDLGLWEGAKIYFAGSVRFSSDVEASDVDKLKAFIAKEQVYCRESLLPSVVGKCDRFKTKLVLYKNRLFFNESQGELSRSYLMQGNGSVTIVNKGVLAIDPSITGNDIREVVDGIRNSGILSVSDSQMGAVQEKARESDGLITSSSNECSGGVGTGNIGVLKL